VERFYDTSRSQKLFLLKDIRPHNPQLFQITYNGYIVTYRTFASLTTDSLYLAALYRSKLTFMKMNASPPSKMLSGIYVTSVIVNEQALRCVCDVGLFESLVRSEEQSAV
jgi:hypothetical protein